MSWRLAQARVHAGVEMTQGQLGERLFQGCGQASEGHLHKGVMLSGKIHGFGQDGRIPGNTRLRGWSRQRLPERDIVDHKLLLHERVEELLQGYDVAGQG